MAAEWKTIALLSGQVPPSWTIAQDFFARGAQGARVPSFQNRGGTNLVLWRWNAADHADDTATLTLLDPDRMLTNR